MDNAAPHVDDAVLVRIIDHEPLPGDDSDHVAECRVCSARAGELRRVRDRFRRALTGESTAPPPDLWDRVVAEAARRGASPPDADSRDGPPRRRRTGTHGWRQALRVAAVMAVLVAGALTAEPVRSWLADAVERAAAVLRTGEPPADVTAAAAVRFVPAVDTIEIRLDHQQEAGTLELIFEDRPDAVGEIVTSDPAAELLVLPGAFRVRDNTNRDWSYRFQLPTSLAAARVIIGGGTVAVVPAEAGTTRIDVRSSGTSSNAVQRGHPGR